MSENSIDPNVAAHVYSQLQDNDLLRSILENEPTDAYRWTLLNGDLTEKDTKKEEKDDKKMTLSSEQLRSLFPPAEPQRTHVSDAVVITPEHKAPEEVKEVEPTITKYGPSFTSGLNHAQVEALAKETKEKLIEQGKHQVETSLYDEFDSTLTKLLEEIQNSDVLSSGQKAALLMKVNITSGSILKESYEVNV